MATVTVEESELSSRRTGDQHFHALRDYVLGDEPRTIHWRSSARAGHLVVRQQVAAATNGTAIVLDTNSAAYGSDERFGSAWIEERFEQAVEVAASLCCADVGRNERLHLLATTRDWRPIASPEGGAAGFVDALAVVGAVATADTADEELPAILRRTKCSRAIFVSGSPNDGAVESLRRIRRSGISVVVVRVASSASSLPRDLRVIELPRAELLDVAFAGPVV
jgi:uncharacterized protein (DUF58 family)